MDERGLLIVVRELAQRLEHAGGKQQMQVQVLYSQFLMKINFNIERGKRMEEVSPIKDTDDIQAMKDYLREWNEMYYMLFITGLNTGLRVGDILTLKVKDVQGWHIKLRERKTGKQISRRMTKELKREMRKYVEGKPFHHFLFKSRQGGNKAITRERAYQIIHEAAEELGIDNVGTHTMRKTFGYKYYNKTKDVGTLQKMFNHSSPAITLRYIGIEQAELDDALRNFVI